jgi:nonsense-mediated mRNA decay protein 3
MAMDDYKFCPKCGTTSGIFIEQFCKKCYLEDHELVKVPKHISVKRCKRCEKILLSGKWVEASVYNLENFIKNKVKPKEMHMQYVGVKLLGPTEQGLEAIVEIKGKVAGVKLNVERHVHIEFIYTTCISCMRIASGYYEAIIQVRARPEQAAQLEPIKTEIKRFMEALYQKDTLFGHVKFKSTQGGFDAIIGAKSSAKKLAVYLAKRYNATLSSNTKLVGVTRDGERRKRVIYLVRLRG